MGSLQPPEGTILEAMGSGEAAISSDEDLQE